MLPLSLPLLLQFDHSHWESLRGFGLRGWDGFTRYFVGEDLLIQLGALSGSTCWPR